jgi:hypothetical protein
LFVPRTLRNVRGANNDYLPELGEEREIITAKERRGKFALLGLPELPANMKWDIAYDDLDAAIDRDGDGRVDVTLLVVKRGDEPAMPALTPLQRRLLESKIALNNRLLDTYRKSNLEYAAKIRSLVGRLNERTWTREPQPIADEPDLNALLDNSRKLQTG